MTIMAIHNATNALDPQIRVERRQEKKGSKGRAEFSFGLVEEISVDRDGFSREDPRSYTTHNAPVRRYSAWLSRANRLIGTLRLIDQELDVLSGAQTVIIGGGSGHDTKDQSKSVTDNGSGKVNLAQLLDDFVEEAGGFVKIESIGRIMRHGAVIFSDDSVEAAQGVAKTKMFVQWTLQQLIDTMQDLISRRGDILPADIELAEELASDTAEQVSLSIDVDSGAAIEAQANLDPHLAVGLLAINEIRRN